MPCYALWLGLVVLSSARGQLAVPADVDGAVGSNQVMTVCNPTVLVQDRNGNLQSIVSHDHFWTNGVDGVALTPYIGRASDPRVVYDAQEGRWIVSAAADTLLPGGSLLLAVSAGEDPTGPWFRYRIPAGTNATDWIDNPNLGFNRHWISVHCALVQQTTNGVDYTGHLFVFDKMNLYTNGPANPLIIPLGPNEINMVPASTLDPLEDDLFLVHFPANSLMPRISTISGPVGGEQFALNIATANNAEVWSAMAPLEIEFAPQLGTAEKIAAQGRPFTSCLLRNGALWFAHQIYQPLLFPNRSEIQWWQASTNGAVLQHGRIDDPSGEVMCAMPSLAVNQNDDMLIGFSRFSADTYVGAGYAYRAGTDPPNTLQATRNLKTGEGPYARPNSVGINVWGDHSASAVDPVDDTALWTIQEYAVGPSNLWGTWWGKVAPPPPLDLHLTLNVSSSNVVEGAPLTYTITVTNDGPITATNASVRNVLSSLVTFSAATSTVGMCSLSNDTVACSLGDLAVGAGATITIDVTNAQPGIVQNTAYAFSNEADTNLLDNVAAVTACVDFAVLPDIWINEIHYDDANLIWDQNQGIEIAGPAGVNLSAFQLVLYDGQTGDPYNAVALQGIIDDETNGLGAIWFPFSHISNGAVPPLILNGDGVALATFCGQVIEFISYEGVFMANSGPAAGLMSVDIGVEESDATPVGYALQLIGMGLGSADFTWHAPLPASPGQLNARQYVETPEFADLALSAGVTPSIVTNGDSVVYSLTITNHGPDTAELAGLDLQLPDAVQFCGAASSAGTWTHTNGLVQCQLGSLTTTGETITVTVTGITQQVLSHSALVEAYAKQNDAAPGDNTATLIVCAAFDVIPNIWINEFHYEDSTLFDANEGVEIAGQAGIDLDGYTILLYDGTSGNVYKSFELSGQIDDEGPGYGAVWFAIDGIQNGQLFPPLGQGDGIALAPPCSGIIQFLSYETSFIGNDGQAAGMAAVDIGVFQSGATPTNQSLQLIGSGSQLADFTWSGPTMHSRGSLNAGQTAFPADDPDLDGIPSDWETLHFGGPTNAVPGDDPDGDGFTNLEEYIADTIPTNALSFFHITAITFTGTPVIVFDSSTARVYGVQSSTDLVSGAWSPVETNLPGVGGPMPVPDTNAVVPSSYRSTVGLP